MGWQRTAFDWNQARAFLVTAEEGSLSAAARALGLTQPTLSRQVAALEETLGVTLFERTARALLLTHSGEELLAHFRNMGQAAHHISIAATGLSETVSGHVAISATDLMAAEFLPDILKALRSRAPGLQIEIITSNAMSDLRRREADIAIRHGRPKDEHLVARRVRDASSSPYAASAYLDDVGRPSTAAELARLRFIGTDDPERLLAPLAQRGIQLTADHFGLIAASNTLCLELIRQGLGVGFLPDEIAARHPELENPWPAFQPMPIETWLVTHRELRTNPGIRLVFDALAEGLS